MNKICHSCRLYNCILNSKRQFLKDSNHTLLTKMKSIISNTCCFTTIHQVKYFRCQGRDCAEQKLREAHLVVRQRVRLQVRHRALHFQINPGRKGVDEASFLIPLCFGFAVLVLLIWLFTSLLSSKMRMRWPSISYISGFIFQQFVWGSIDEWVEKIKNRVFKKLFLLFWTSHFVMKSSVAFPTWLFNFHCIFCFVLFFLNEEGIYVKTWCYSLPYFSICGY